MVREQIIRRGISNNQVIDVMQNTPRHRFVPDGVADYAYQDNALPIGKGQTISQPYIVAFMTETLDVDSTYKVLEIGTGSGYQAAVLSPLVKHVYTIEIVKMLAQRADSTLKALSYNNVTVRWGDGYKGWPEQAPFDRIIGTAAPPEIPKALIDQLKPGGKMVLPVGTNWQEIVVLTKSKSGKIQKKNVLPVRFVPMVHQK
ncbi:MAG: protein-L-isoaspartate(D-aspartate) O-methyltransferase [Candidatus Neomarinimicrobiota bacterium]|nr:protein-L-isoaspartate(D-aspartate) O-methyltransferase [Candidatus Neomarinimicrobiota bacterium]